MNNIKLINRNSVLYSELMKLKMGDYSSYEYFYSITSTYFIKMIEEISGVNSATQEDITRLYNSIYASVKEKECETFYSWAGEIATGIAIEKCFAKIQSDIVSNSFQVSSVIPERMIEDEERFICEDVLVNSAIQQIFLERLEELSVGQKIILQLYYYNDKSISEISNALNVNVFSVRSNVAFIKKKMSDIMCEYYGENYLNTQILHSMSEIPIAWMLFFAGANGILLSQIAGSTAATAGGMVGSGAAIGGATGGVTGAAIEGVTGAATGGMTGAASGAAVATKVGIGIGAKIGIAVACTAVAVGGPVTYYIATKDKEASNTEIVSEITEETSSENENYTEETSEEVVEETTVTEAEVIEYTQEELLYNFVLNELEPIYGFADLSYEEKGDRTEEEWIFYNGIISAYIDDLDLDGNMEMLVSIIQYFPGDEAGFNQVNLILYTVVDNQVVETDNISSMKVYNDYSHPSEDEVWENKFGINSTAYYPSKFTCSMLDSDNLGKIICIEKMDGWYYSSGYIVKSMYMIKDKHFVVRYQEELDEGYSSYCLCDENGLAIESYCLEWGETVDNPISPERIGINSNSESVLFYAECSMNFEEAENNTQGRDMYYYTYRLIQDYSQIREH